ncbi:legumain-like [Adelges cooleyi]|uniref:legumain-like n=1 Tax=Adelges cooleyi TaxID=133065 RepID=UPI0021806C43|nr:legumain-like [Adelges cooleyi]
MELHRLCLILLLAIGSQGSLLDYVKGNFFLGKKWVVLVAGSDGWENYRHQADVAHAYQVVRRNGIPEENIIVMMANDVVNHTSNWAPGTLINQPNGTDVYKGIKIDYAGSNVTKENFLSVLKGDKHKMSKIGSGKVVKSSSHDNIFINFVGDGESGVVYFPGNKPLYADELIRTLKELYIRRKYEKILLYVDACYSGSMFDGLLDDNKSILAITAAGPRENAYTYYYDEQYDTYLGDEFGISWMENWDKVIVEASKEASARTVFKHYEKTRTKVTDSNVMIYGDFHLGFEKLSSFIGFSYGQSSASKTNKVLNLLKTGDVAEFALKRQLIDTKDQIKRESLSREIGHKKNKKQLADKIMNEIYKKVVKEMPEVAAKIGTLEKPAHLKLNMDMFPCYRSIVNHISEKCFSFLKNRQVQINIFANICVVNEKAHHFINKFIDVACQHGMRSTQL